MRIGCGSWRAGRRGIGHETARGHDMNWQSTSQFFDMGGYGLYVWGSYIVTAIAMALEPWLTARRSRRAFTQVADNSETDSTS